ncbi:MAG: hypothetical protein KO202_06275 [Methanobacteriaceae archaeon]|nr:hypothetical protein [Methanobacteriaceae archaeon]
MNLKKLIIISLIMFLAIGIVNAENSTEDINEPIIANENNNNDKPDLNLEEYVVSSSDTINNDLSSKYEINDENYNDYFNSSTGYLLDNTNISDGDVLKIGNVTNKTFNIDRYLNITSISSNDIIKDSYISLNDNSSGTNIFNLTFNGGKNDNGVLSISDGIKNININNCFFNNYHASIFMKLVDNINIYNNSFNITSNNKSKSFAVSMSGSVNVDIYNNLFKLNSIDTNYTNAIVGDGINVSIDDNDFAVSGNNNVYSIKINGDGIDISNNTISTSVPNIVANWDLWPIIGYNSGSLNIDGNNVNIINNSIETIVNNISISGGTIVGISISNSDNLTFKDNNVFTKGTDYVYGLDIANVGSANVLVLDNNIKSESKDTAYALKLTAYPEGVISGNNLSAAANLTYTVLLEGNMMGLYGTNGFVNFTNNNISSLANYSVGIDVYDLSNSVFVNNAINGNGIYSLGLRLVGGSSNNTFINNKVDVNGIGNGTNVKVGYDGFYFDNTGFKLFAGANNNTIIANHIVTNGTYAVLLNNTIHNNTVTENYLYGKDLLGDNSVIYVGNNTVIDNYPKTSVLNASNIVMYYKNGTKYIVYLTDGDGKAIANETVIISVNGVSYTKITDTNGIATLNLNLLPNNYTITTVFNSDKYLNTSITTNLTVLTVLSGNNLVKYYRNGTQYNIKVLDAQGNPLAHTNVSFNINGVFYTRNTNVNGTATLNINLYPGNYTITSTFNGLSMSNSIEVLPTLIGKDLTKNFGEAATYDIDVLDGQGNPLANQTVSININGVLYNKISDVNGIARLNINLNPGDYIATATWNEYSTSNKVIVEK